MNKTQEALLTNEFMVNEHFTITRGYYENLPCPMLAWTWSDERMKQLAQNINNNLARWDDNDPEGMEDDFWSTMENEAVHMGMEYYDDLEEDYLAELEYDWRQIK